MRRAFARLLVRRRRRAHVARYTVRRCRIEYDDVAHADSEVVAHRLLEIARASEPGSKFNVWDHDAGCWSMQVRP
jgi:hypothetical protein